MFFSSPSSAASSVVIVRVSEVEHVADVGSVQAESTDSSFGDSSILESACAMVNVVRWFEVSLV